MHHSVVMLLLVGCTGKFSATPPASPETEVQPPVVETPPEAEVSPATSQPGLIDGVAGWPGFVGTEDSALVRHPQGEVVLLNSRNLEATAGNDMVVVGPPGQAVGQFVEHAEVPVGCDDIPTPVTAIDLAADWPDGPVWVLPQGSTIAAASVPLVEGPRTADDVRTWQAGDATIRLSRRDTAKGTVALLQGEQSIHTVEFEKHYMEGADEGALDLYGQWEVGRPTPVAVWHLSPSDQHLYMFAHRGYEGMSWSIWVVENQAVVGEGVISLYLCAF